MPFAKRQTPNAKRRSPKMRQILRAKNLRANVDKIDPYKNFFSFSEVLSFALLELANGPNQNNDVCL